MSTNFLSSQRPAIEKQPDVSSRLTQTYRLGSPLGGFKIVPLCDSQGRFHVFTLGNDGHLYEVYQDGGSDTGWSVVDMNFPTTSNVAAFTAGVGADGVTMVFATDNSGSAQNEGGLFSIRDTRWATWQKFQDLNYTIVGMQTCHDYNGELTLITREVDASNSAHLYWADYTQQDTNWGLANTSIQDPTVSAINDFQVGLDASLAPDSLNKGLSTWLVGMCSNDEGESFHPAGKRTPWQNGQDDYWAWNVSDGYTRVALAPAPGNPKDSVAFTIAGADCGLYVVDTPSQQLVKLSGTTQLAEISPYLDPQGLLCVIALGVDQYLYHVRQDPSSASGWTEMVPLSNVRTFLAVSTVTDRSGGMMGFAIGTQQELWQLWRDASTQEWHFVQIEVGTGPLQELTAYVTKYRVTDERGAPCPGADVSIEVSGPTPAMINGAAAMLDPQRPLRCQADPGGYVTVVVDADALDTPWLSFSDATMLPGEFVQVEPNAAIQSKLRSLTADDLLNAKDYDGQPITLLTGTNATADVANAIAQACNQAMDMVGAGRPRGGVHRLRSGTPFATRRLDLASVPDQSWMLDFSGPNGPVFTPLSNADANTLISERRTTLRDAGEFGIDWGDIWDDVVDTVTEVVDVIVTATVDAVTKVVTEIKAMVTLVIDGVRAFFETSIRFVETVFAMVEGFFAKVGVALKKLWDWLCDLFRWGEIKLTAQVISHMLGVGLSFSSAAAAQAASVVTRKIEDATHYIDAGLEDFITSFCASRTIGDISESTLGPVYADLDFSNPMLDALIISFGATPPGGHTARAVELNPTLQALLDQLTQLANQFETSEGGKALAKAAVYFAEIGNQPDKVVDLLLKGLLEIAKAIAIFAMNAAEAVVAAVFAALGNVIDALRGILFDPLDIPLVSAIYEYATGGTLCSLGDAIAVAIAIPTNAVYRQAYGAAPFDAGTVDQITGNLSVEWLERQAWGMAAAEAPRATKEPWLQTLRGACDCMYGANFICRTPVEMAINGSEVPIPPLAWINFAQRLMSSMLSIPWIMKDQAVSPFDESAAGLENFIWITQLAFGPLRGGLILVSGASQLADPTLTAWGGIHLVMEALLWGKERDEKHPDPEKTTERMLTCFAPQFLKVLRLAPVKAATDDFSVAALVILTGFSEPTIAYLHWDRTLPPGSNNRALHPPLHMIA